MINIIQNTVSALKSSLGIIRKGLELFLPFAKSEIIGRDLVVNGDFSNGTTDWLDGDAGSGLSVDDGKLKLKNEDGSSAMAAQELSIVSGKTYLFSYESYQGTSSSENSLIGLGSSVNNVTKFTANFTTDGEHTHIYTANFTGTAFVTVKNGTTTLNEYMLFDNISIKEVSQFAPDKSTNTNDAKLFTGKALSFDGVNDSVDADYSSSTRTIAFWLKPRGSGTSEGIMYLGYSGGQMGLKFGSSIISTTVLTGVTTYVNNVNTTSITLDAWQRVVITADLFTPTVLRLGYAYLNAYGDFSITDLQFYDTAWTAADVTYDYNNPQHLVTDNSASSIALSNLKGYWHLSEGDGAYAYNSAIALGSEEVTNGDFATDTDWTKAGGATTSGGVGYMPNTGSLAQSIGMIAGKTYIYTIIAKGDSVTGDLRIASGGTQVFEIENLPSTFQTYTGTFVGVGATLLLSEGNAGDITIQSISVKEVSAGEINGATWETALATIPQLGMMDWAKSTVGSDEITLIQAPNNEGYDILGNALRLRENALNLDGSGYAEIADDDTLDFGTGDFTIEAWSKFKYENTDSIINVIISLGGLYGNTTSASLVTDSDQFKFYIGGTLVSSSSSLVVREWYHIVCTRKDGDMRLYIDTEIEGGTSTTSTQTITNSLTKYIGKDSSDDRPYQDLIDETRIYNRALSASEITQNFKAGKNKHKN